MRVLLALALVHVTLAAPFIKPAIDERNARKLQFDAAAFTSALTSATSALAGSGSGSGNAVTSALSGSGFGSGFGSGSGSGAAFDFSSLFGGSGSGSGSGFNLFSSILGSGSGSGSGLASVILGDDGNFDVRDIFSLTEAFSAGSGSGSGSGSAILSALSGSLTTAFESVLTLGATALSSVSLSNPTAIAAQLGIDATTLQSMITTFSGFATNSYLLGLSATPPVIPASLSGFVDSFRAPVCQYQSTFANLLTSQQFFIDSGFPTATATGLINCICTAPLTGLDSTYTLGLALYNDLSSQPELASDTATIVPRILAIAREAIPAFATMPCGSTCQTHMKDTIDWVTTHQALTGLWSEYISLSLDGMGTNSMNCICGGARWDILANLIVDDLATVFTQALTGQGLTGLTGLEDDDIETVAVLADYAISSSALCAGGCQPLFAQLLGIGRQIFTSQVGSYAEHVGLVQLTGWPITPEKNATANALVNNLLGSGTVDCICAGSMSLTEVLTDLATTANTTTFTDQTDVAIMLANSLTRPAALCSSATCANTVTGLMGGFDLLLGLNSSTGTFSEYQWCPAAAGTAGTTVTRSMVMSGELSYYTQSTVQSSMKKAFADEINNDNPNALTKVMAGDVGLAFTSGSVNLDVSITVSSDSFATSVQTSITTMTTTEIATAMSSVNVTVVVESLGSVSTTTTAQNVYSPDANVANVAGTTTVYVAPASSEDNTGLIIGIAAGAGVITIAIIILAVVLMKGGSAKAGGAVAKATTTQATAQAVTGTAVESGDSNVRV